jgi:hypothetical protein
LHTERGAGIHMHTEKPRERGVVRRRDANSCCGVLQWPMPSAPAPETLQRYGRALHSGAHTGARTNTHTQSTIIRADRQTE